MLAEAISHASSRLLRTLETASLEVLACREGGGTLILASVPTFTTKCLIPRLSAFSAANPGVTLNFRQHLAGSDPMPYNVDAAVRFGEGSWPGVTSEYLSGREFIVVCSGQLLKRRRELRSDRGLTAVTLLRHHAVPLAWAQWCSARGVQGVNAHAGPRFEQYASLIRAITADMGVGLVPRCLVQDELRSHLRASHSCRMATFFATPQIEMIRQSSRHFELGFTQLAELLGTSRFGIDWSLRSSSGGTTMLRWPPLASCSNSHAWTAGSRFRSPERDPHRCSGHDVACSRGTATSGPSHASTEAMRPCMIVLGDGTRKIP